MAFEDGYDVILVNEIGVIKKIVAEIRDELKTFNKLFEIFISDFGKLIDKGLTVFDGYRE